MRRLCDLSCAELPVSLMVNKKIFDDESAVASRKRAIATYALDLDLMVVRGQSLHANDLIFCSAMWAVHR
jgi:hypothetical protein